MVTVLSCVSEKFKSVVSKAEKNPEKTSPLMHSSYKATLSCPISRNSNTASVIHPNLLNLKVQRV